MNTKWTGLVTIGVFLTTTMAIFMLLVYGLPSLWCNMSVQEICTESLAAIEALSTALAAAAVFGAGYIAYRELSEVSNSRYMEVADRLFEELNSPENIEARRRIFQNLHQNPKTGLKRLTQKDRDAMKKVLNSLDRVAFLTQSGWIPNDLIMPWMHPMIAKSWEKLEPYVQHERERRNEPYYYRYAEELAGRCNKWREKNLTDTATIWVDNAL